MENTQYNGWVNRKTWLVNLHFGDEIIAHLQSVADMEEISKDTSYSALSNEIETYFNELVEDDLVKLSDFLLDFLDLSLIDFRELASSYYQDLDFPDEENEDEDNR